MTQNWTPPPGQQWPSQPAWNVPSGWAAPPPPPASPGAVPPPPYRPGVPAAGAYPPPPRPPAKKSPLLAILGGGAFVLIVMFFGVALLNYLNAGPGGPGSEPSYHQVTNVPEPDFNPPPLPKPQTEADLVNWTKHNPIYSHAVPVPTNCKVPYLDASTADVQALDQHLSQLTACLWGVWEVPMTEAGYQIPRPPVTVYTTEITSPCGKLPLHNAFYCSADQHVYYAQNVYEIIDPALQSKPFLPEFVLAHEFGHAVQARTGIFYASAVLEQLSDKTLANEYSRRSETQADCFSGLFLNAIASASGLTDADRTNVISVAASLGSPQPDPADNHGTSASRVAWTTAGLGNSQIGQCNTFAVGSEQVR